MQKAGKKYDATAVFGLFVLVFCGGGARWLFFGELLISNLKEGFVVASVVTRA